MLSHWLKLTLCPSLLTGTSNASAQAQEENIVPEFSESKKVKLKTSRINNQEQSNLQSHTIKDLPYTTGFVH